MININWEIELYEKPNGRCPVADFINKLSPKEKVIILNRFSQLQEHGLDLGRPLVGYLRDNIHELRIKINSVNYRILFFVYDRTIFVLTHVIIKKSDKVPDFEIEKAIEYRNSYIKSKLSK